MSWSDPLGVVSEDFARLVCLATRPKLRAGRQRLVLPFEVGGENGG
jgi:hypothetical protein